MRVSALFAVLMLLPQAQTGASRLILAAVTDARGRAIVDVGADDFAIEEGGSSREILSARVADYPIVVMMDTGIAARADFVPMQKAAARFIEHLGRERPIIVGTFGDVPRLLDTFDDSREVVLARLADLSATGAGASHLLRGAALAARTLRATGALFSAIVILSASPTDSSPETPEEILSPIIDSGAIVHAIVNRGTRDAEPRTRNAEPGTRHPDLRDLVQQTRGEFTAVYSPASYDAALDRLVERLGTEMMVEYLVPPGSKPLDAKIGIRLPGARVRGLGVAPK